jgi:hypothetical protein
MVEDLEEHKRLDLAQPNPLGRVQPNPTVTLVITQRWKN